VFFLLSQTAFHLIPGVVMLDTATGYSQTETKLGQWLSSHLDLMKRTYIATKFGGSYERDLAGDDDHGFDMSRTRMIQDFDRSASLLGKVDLLYSHLTNQVSFENSMKFLRDEEQQAMLMQWRDESKYGLQHIGASISNGKVLAAAAAEGLLNHYDALQIPGYLAIEMPDVSTS